MPVNNHIRDYIDYYCGLEAPDYAVLLSGKWGSGKSHFISDYQETQTDKKFIYVSLYGLQNTSQINDSFFEQLHPILSSKGMDIAGKVVKGALRATLRFDLDGDDKSDGSVQLKLPDSVGFLNDSKDHILIFDDLERCCMPIAHVLGYINSFVEHHDRHVILIADESKVKDEAYAKIKEKLIGQAFEIHVDIDNALDSFCNKVTNDKCRIFLIANKSFICDVFSASKYNNLRTLKKIIQDFNRIFEVLPEEAKGKDVFLLNMLGILMMLSFEVRCGGVDVEDVGDLLALSFRTLLSEDEGDDEISKRQKKYQHLLDISVPDVDLWKEYLRMGVFSAKRLEEAVTNSIYFQNKNTPNWVRLWNGLDLDDADFKKVRKLVEKSLEAREYKKAPVIMHVCGHFLWMAKNKLYDKTEQQVLADFQAYVDALVAENTLEFDEDENSSTWNDSHAGLMYFSRGEAEFITFCTYITSQAQKVKEAAYPEQAEKLLELMVSDNRLFYRLVCLSNSEDNKYYRIPIFKYIKPETFVESMVRISPKDRRRLGDVFKSRYEHLEINKSLVDELDWLKLVRTLLENEVENLKGTISGYVFQAIIDAGLTPAISNLEAVN